MVEKIPVIDVLKQSLMLLRENAVAAVILFGGLALAGSAITVIWFPTPDPVNPKIDWLAVGLLLLVMLVAIPSRTAWYRRVLSGARSSGGLGWRIGREEGLLLLAGCKFSGWIVLAMALVGIPLAALTYGIGMLAHLSSNTVQVMAVSIVGIGILIVIVWALPLVLMFPAAALGMALSRKQAFALASGNRWRLLLLACVIPGGLGHISGKLVGLSLPPAVSIILYAVASLLLMSFNGALLALCYRHLASPAVVAEDGAGAPSPELG